MKIKIIFFLLFIALALSTGAQDINRIVARVNNKIITSKDLNEYSKSAGIDISIPSVYKKALEHFIDEKLIIYQAHIDKVKVPEEWLKTNINKLISRYDSYGAFIKDLISQGLNINILKKRIKESFMVRQEVNKYVISQVKVSPSLVMAYYNIHKLEFISLTKYICWITKSNDESFLDKLSDEIRKKGFNKVLEDNKDVFFKIESDEKGLKKEVVQFVKKAKAGEFAIKNIGEVYYLIYLVDVIPAHKKLFSEVKGNIYQRIWEKEFSKEFKLWIKSLKDKVLIKIYGLSSNLPISN